MQTAGCILQFLAAIAQEIPNIMKRIVHIIPKAAAGGLNFTTLPASFPTLQKKDVPNPIINGNIAKI